MTFVKKLILLTIFFPLSAFSQNLIMNGDMEAGAGGAGVVPTNWTIVQHTPDNCASPPATCPGPSYVINNPSPNGGKWVRFFRGGGWNERFGQYICQPLVAGQTYTLEFWASHSDLNSSANATNTGIDFGFSNGLPGGSGAGTGNAGNVALTTPEVWQFVSVTFVAAANYDFISFAKNTTDTQNAAYVDGVTLVGQGPSIPILPPDTTLCTGATLLLDVSGFTGPYTWQDGSTNATFNVTTAGQYYVDAGTGTCVATDTINVTYAASPPLNLGNDTILCTGQNLVLDASSVPGPYLWNDASTNPTLNATTTGQYFVEAGSGGCMSYDTINVTFNPNATVNLGNDTIICTGAVLVLDASAAPAPYLWQDGSTNATFNVTTTGQYYVDVGSGACSGTDTINVTVSPQLNFSLGNDTTLCNGQNLMLDVSAVTGTYTWQDASTNPTYNVTVAGQYYVDIVNGACTGSDSINVTYVAAPTINLGNDTTLCDGQNLLLDASPSGGPYLWQDASTNATFNVTTSGLYSVQVGSGGCTSTDDINVTFQSYPNPNLGPDLSLCAGTAVTLDPGTGAGPYLWQDGSTNATLQANGAGTYWVEVGTLCTASDTIVINEVTVNVNMSLDDSTSCDTLSVQFFGNAVTNGAGVQNWNWDLGNTTSNVQNPSNFYNPGTYTVSLTVTTVEGCMATVNNANWINVYDSPVASFTFDPQQPTVENPVVDFTDYSYGASTWSWNFGNGQGSSINQNPTYEFPALANYTYTVELTVTDLNGCTDVTQQLVTIEDVIIFYVPNIFTPDGDIYNESFMPAFTSGIDPYNFHMTIFNRWGEIIFETYNKDIGWDGTYGDGGLVQDGTYIWKIEFSETKSDKRHEHHGHVTVLK